MSCENHKKEVAGITDMKLLAEMIGDLHYEAMGELFVHLAEKYQTDRFRNIEIGHDNEATCLLWMHYAAAKLSTGAERAWKISKPFMKEKDI